MSATEKQVKQVRQVKQEAEPAKCAAGMKQVKVKSGVRGGPFKTS